MIVAAVPEAPATGLLDVPQDAGERLVAQAARFGAVELSRAADIVAAGLTEMRGATAPRLLLELICARVLLPGADDTSDGVMARLDRIERRLDVVRCGERTVRPTPPRPVRSRPDRPPPAPSRPGRSPTRSARQPSRPSRLGRRTGSPRPSPRPRRWLRARCPCRGAGRATSLRRRGPGRAASRQRTGARRSGTLPRTARHPPRSRARRPAGRRGGLARRDRPAGGRSRRERSGSVGCAGDPSRQTRRAGRPAVGPAGRGRSRGRAQHGRRTPAVARHRRRDQDAPPADLDRSSRRTPRSSPSTRRTLTVGFTSQGARESFVGRRVRRDPAPGRDRRGRGRVAHRRDHRPERAARQRPARRHLRLGPVEPAAPQRPRRRRRPRRTIGPPSTPRPTGSPATRHRRLPHPRRRTPARRGPRRTRPASSRPARPWSARETRAVVRNPGRPRGAGRCSGRPRRPGRRHPGARQHRAAPAGPRRQGGRGDQAHVSTRTTHVRHSRTTPQPHDGRRDDEPEPLRRTRRRRLRHERPAPAGPADAGAAGQPPRSG